MEEQAKKQERSFELRSEKVRSIVGQIPSALIRYGITAIGAVLLCLLAVACFLPYKQVYSGTAVIYSPIAEYRGDSAEVAVKLKFEGKRLNEANALPINLQSPSGAISGKVVEISAIRDTLDRQKAIVLLDVSEIKRIENQSVDFQMVQSSGNLLSKLLELI